MSDCFIVCSKWAKEAKLSGLKHNTGDICCWSWVYKSAEGDSLSLVCDVYDLEFIFFYF